jgi:photosystem II stability/assembly factor-like uncharacterized protein
MRIREKLRRGPVPEDARASVSPGSRSREPTGRLTPRHSARIVLLTLLVGWLTSTPAQAHVPHDHVFDLAPSPTFSRDGTVFAIVRNTLFKSVDGGYEWRRIHRGLCQHRPVRLAISPEFESDDTLFSACIEGELFRSHSAGARWQRLDAWPGLGIEDLAVSPRFGIDRGALVLASNGTLHRTSDAGAVWNTVAPEIVGITAIAWRGVAAVVGTDSGEAHVSQDGGATWTLLGAHPSRQSILVVEIPEDLPDRRFFVGTTTGVLAVGADGSFQPCTGGPSAHVTGIASRTRAGRVALWATTWHEATFRSEDGGATWIQFAEGLLKHEQADSFGVPHFTAVDVVGDSTLLVSSFFGVNRSDDDGRTWNRLETTLGHITGLDVSPSEAGRFTLGLSTYGAGFHLSDDGGESWRSASRGLWHPRPGAPAFSPEYLTDRTIHLGGHYRMMLTTDEGASWSQVPIVRPRTRFENLRARIAAGLAGSQTFGKLRPLLLPEIELHRTEPASTVPLAVAVSPAYSRDRTVFVGLRPDGVRRSTDGGATYPLIWKTRGEVQSLVVSPDFEQDRTVLASLRDGVHRSLDAGESWKRVEDDPDIADALLALSPAFGTDRTVYAGGESGLFRSRDAGDSWERLPIGGEDEGRSVDGLVLSPDFANDRVLLVQTRGGNLLFCHDGPDGFETTPTGAADAGYEFTHVVRRDRDPLMRFSPDYAVDGTVYAASVNQLVRSTDGGMTWVEIPRPVRLEAEAPFWEWLDLAVELEGEWKLRSSPQSSCRSLIRSSEPGSTATIRFHGTGARWVGMLSPRGGTATVVVDGRTRARVDLHAETTTHAAQVFAVEDLARGPHTLTILVEGSVNVDAIDVTP